MYHDRMDFVRPIEAVIPGVQGRVLAVLAHTEAELNLRTIARLAEVSPAQVSRVLPPLVQLGLVERREVPPSSLFRLSSDHVAAQPLRALTTVRETTLAYIGEVAANLQVAPESIVVFGSLARGEADARSDIDVLIVRPAAIAGEDEAWADSVEELRAALRAKTGNTVEVLEAGSNEVERLLASDRPLWRDIRRDGLVVFGRRPADLTAAHA